MRIPKYIDRLIYKRAKLADNLFDVDYELSEWIDNHEIVIDPENYRGGVEMYANPWVSASAIREAIQNK